MQTNPLVLINPLRHRGYFMLLQD